MSEEENNNIEINPSMGHEEGGGGLRNIYKKSIDASEVLESPSYQDLSAYLCANILNYAFGKYISEEFCAKPGSFVGSIYDFGVAFAFLTASK